jgi:serine/threonine protein kinase
VLQERYRVMRLLTDKSGFGFVYEAYERNLPKILKVLKPKHNNTPKAIELFEQEALVLSRLQHPGIPKVEEDGCFQFRPTPEGEPLHCIIMEKIDGPNLSEWMRQQGGNPISEKQALNWLRQIADVLNLVHHENFFHRDIKPENIMLRSNGQLVLVDFGAAREMTYTYFEQMGATGGITKVSSAGYTPPEQERGQAVPQSDFYALGCTFIFLLTGRQPTEPAIYDSLDNEFRWRQFAPQISTDFADLIDCMTSVRASARPKSTEELLDRIVAIAQAAYIRSNTSPLHYEHNRPLNEGKPRLWPQEPQPSYPSRNDQALPSERLSTSAPPNTPMTDPHHPWSHEVNVPDMKYPDSAFPEAPSHTALHQTPHYPTTNLSEAYQLDIPSHPDAVPLSPKGDHSNGAPTASPSYSQAPTSAIPTSDPQPKHKPWKIIAAGTLAIAILGGVGIWQLIDSQQPQESEVVEPTTPYSQPEILSGHTENVTVLAISNDQQLLASGSHDNQVLLWDMVTREMTFALTGHKNMVRALAFTPNDRYIASAGEDLYIKISDTQTGDEIKTLTGHTQSVNDLVFTSDGTRLISASADSTINIWDWRSGDILMTLTGHEGFINTIALSPDGKVLASGAADNTIRLWDLSTGEEIGQLLGHTSFVNALAISPDGQKIASASADTTIKIWNRFTQRELRTLDEHESYVNDLLISPDGRFLLSSSADQTIKLWELNTGELNLSIPWPGTFIDAIAVKFQGTDWQVVAGGKGSNDIQVWQLQR